MILIVGLGNPGEKYKNTRHNLGFMVVEKLAKDLLPLKETRWEFNQKANALILKVSPQAVLVKPQTFMNASGYAVSFLVSYYQLATGDLWVVHDDVDLPLGKLKIRFGGASAGHYGIESIIERLGTDKFWRVRLGIGRPAKGAKERNRGARDIEKYVLGEFAKDELGKLKNLVKKAVEAIRVVMEEGPERAMNELKS